MGSTQELQDIRMESIKSGSTVRLSEAVDFLGIDRGRVMQQMAKEQCVCALPSPRHIHRMVNAGLQLHQVFPLRQPLLPSPKPPRDLWTKVHSVREKEKRWDQRRTVSQVQTARSLVSNKSWRGGKAGVKLGIKLYHNAYPWLFQSAPSTRLAAKPNYSLNRPPFVPGARWRLRQRDFLEGMVLGATELWPGQ